MKKLSIIRTILVIFISVTIGACTEIMDESSLNQAPEQGLDYEKVFTDYQQYRKFLDYSYKFMPGHLGRLWNSMVCELSDEAQGVGVNICSSVFNNGAWTGDVMPAGTPQANANSELSQLWTDLFKGIRQTNLALDNIDNVTNFPSKEIYDRSKGEAMFVRAFLYFELAKRWGGVPLFDHAVELGSASMDIPRASYDSTIQFIVRDCDRAAALLPLVQPESETGRATKGAAMALKSRALLYAARPLNNPENDPQKWLKAAQAANDVINLNQYSLDPDYVNMFFRPNLGTEIIMNRPRPKINFEQGHTDNSNFLVRFIVPAGYLGWMGTSVTNTFVNLYESSNGYPIQDARSGYNDQNPYQNRDPRLKMTILYNDRFWYDRKTEFFVGGRDYGTSTINPMGYCIAKFWPEAHQRYKGTTTYLNYIFFRYAEILLNYAEACNEVNGPDAPIDGASLTARDASSMLRARVNHVPIPTDISDSKELMRERIINERAVELSFEEQRWYDVISLHRGTQIFGSEIQGMKITKQSDGSFLYQPYKYSNRIFFEHMHRYPIPNSEIYKSSVLIQNPGWN